MSVKTGNFDVEKRTVTLRQLGETLHSLPSVRVADDYLKVLAEWKISRESWVENGLTTIRKRHNGQPLYFVANLADRFREGWISLSVPVGSVQRYDPLTDRTMALLARRGADEKMSFFLSLLPGQSCFLTGSPVPARSVPVQAASGAKGVELTGEWQLEFVAGKPGLPPPARLPTLTSWTTLGDTAAYFSGTARYALTFDLPESSALERSHRLSLGDVREVAEVRLNGQDIGTAWCLPYDVEVPKGLLRKQGNTLDVKVSNLSFNYMRLHDRLQPGWKKFYDINIVNIRYQPFDASKEPPMPSGLLGPVRLEP